MGLMRFDLGSEEILKHEARFLQAFISYYDGSVFPTRIERHGRYLHCIRTKSDSGKLNISWPVQGFGAPVLRTSSLIEREAPYHLAVELARGQLCELRNQAAQWQQAGMLLPDGFQALNRAAFREFVHSTFEQENPPRAFELANQALVKICQAESLLAESYIDQRMQVRRQRFSQPPALFGCDLGPIPVDSIPDDFPERFKAATISLDWRNIEPEEGTYLWETYDEQVTWARRNRLFLKGGPLLSFDEGGLPEWVSNWKHDILNLQSFLSDFVETAVSRYTGQIRIWEVAARVNTGGLYDFNEDNLLSLTARMIDVASQVDNDSQIFVRIDQPWGDYQAKGKHRLSPWHVVDALLRSGMDLTGINLELSLGYEPGHNDSRQLLRFSKLLDTWGAFNIPLHVTLNTPSQKATDPLATKQLQVNSEEVPEGGMPEHQADWNARLISMLMAKQPVVGIFWGHLSDAWPHRFPHAGLLDGESRPKPAWNRIPAFQATGQ